MGEKKMRSVKIFADSTSDLTPEILAAYDIGIVPLYVSFDTATYRDGLDLDTRQLYDLVEKTGRLPKTAAPSPADFSAAFAPHIAAGQDIVYIGISTELSSTCHNALLAATEFPPGRVEVVDSRNLSSGIGLLVLQACDLARQGRSSGEIAAAVRALVPKVRTSFVIDTLDYLYMGGRCTALQSILGSLLRIRPVIKVIDGKMLPAQKLRGPRQNALRSILEETLQDQANIAPGRMMVTHSLGQEDAEYLQAELAKALPSNEIIITKAGCVISSHCGPRTVGILYLRKQALRPE